MYTVAVTGGAGLVGRYVVQRLLENEQIAEVRIIDRQSTSREESRKVKKYLIDLNDRKTLENALRGCDGVIHCAHSPFPIFYSKSKEQDDQMWKDNLDACESVVDSMIGLEIKNLVNIGCAYSPIPNEDNYGLAQDVFLDYPRNYMLDQYGESRTRGEMYARNASKRGSINGIFLRPTFVYGQGKSTKIEAIKELVHNSTLPFVSGERRGMHQFIYAGNLAAIAEKSFFCLLQDPKKFNGEIVFCMDENCAYSIRDFFENRFIHSNYSQDVIVNYWSAFAPSYLNYWKFKLGFEIPENILNHVAFRLFFEKTVGFPNKKLRLLLDSKPEISQEEAFAKYGNPKASYTLETVKRSTLQG
uniref:3Beta_HSD domain-containing protein n=1 Tax=Caenorhabditis tropicalis TaxID=1561998 RepID=A0A1I7TTD3_9PELO